MPRRRRHSAAAFPDSPAKLLNPKIATGILYNRPLEDPFERAKSMRADALFPRRNLVTKGLVQKAHQKGLAVATWTVTW